MKPPIMQKEIKHGPLFFPDVRTTVGHLNLALGT